MNCSTLPKLVLLLMVSCFLSSTIASGVFAEDLEEEENPFPQTGILAGTSSGGYGGTSIGGWAQEDQREPAPISASVSRAGRDEWQVGVFNNSEDKYRVGIEVIQLGERGRRLKGTSMSLSLKPGDSVQRTVRQANGAIDAQVKLRNWKNLTKKDKSTMESEIARKKRELEELEEVTDPAIGIQ